MTDTPSPEALRDERLETMARMLNRADAECERLQDQVVALRSALQRWTTAYWMPVQSSAQRLARDIAGGGAESEARVVLRDQEAPQMSDYLWGFVAGMGFMGWLHVVIKVYRPRPGGPHR